MPRRCASSRRWSSRQACRNRIDVPVIGHVVAEIGHWRAIEGREPYRVDAKRRRSSVVQMVEAPCEPRRSPTAIGRSNPGRNADDLIEGRPSRHQPSAHCHEPSGARGMVPQPIFAGGVVMKEKQTPRNQRARPRRHEPKETAQRLEQKADEQEGESNRARTEDRARARKGARSASADSVLASPQAQSPARSPGRNLPATASRGRNDAAEITDVRVHTWRRTLPARGSSRAEARPSSSRRKWQAA